MPSSRPALTLLLMAAVVVLVGCGSSVDPAPPVADAPGFKVEDPGPVHVHGLGTNPADGSLFIATHTGLFRAAAGERAASRVGGRYQDTMGFTVLGPDRFLGSGHPDLRTGQPPYLGLIQSGDAGRSWKALSLMGRADFHVLEAAGRRVVGYGTDLKTRRPLFLRSDDGGHRWVRLRSIPPLLSLAIDPRDPDVWVAATGEQLLRTRDAGGHWMLLADDSGLLGWRSDGLYTVDLDGHVSASTNGGRTWQRRASVGARPAAFEAERPALLVALHDGTIKRSTDGGRTWRVRSVPEPTVTGVG